MITSPCKTCKYGAILSKGTFLYSFSLAIRKNKEVSYKNNEVGCRMDQWENKEIECISTNFSKYKKEKNI